MAARGRTGRTTVDNQQRRSTKRKMGNTPSTTDTVGATPSIKDGRCDELREAESDTRAPPSTPPKSQDKVDVTHARANYGYGLCVKACADAAKAAESARAAHAHAHTGTGARAGLDHVTRTAAYAEVSYYRCVTDCMEAVDVVNTTNGNGNGDGKEVK